MTKGTQTEMMIDRRALSEMSIDELLDYSDLLQEIQESINYQIRIRLAQSKKKPVKKIAVPAAPTPAVATLVAATPDSAADDFDIEAAMRSIMEDDSPAAATPAAATPNLSTDDFDIEAAMKSIMG